MRRVDLALFRGYAMLRVAIKRIRPEKESRLRAWLAELNSRADEVRETFRGETVRAEQAFIVPGSEGSLLVYVMEAEDFEQGSKAFADSHHKIDAEHIGFREHHATIKQQDLFAVLEHPHVAPNLAGTAERNNAQSVFCHRLL